MLMTTQEGKLDNSFDWEFEFFLIITFKGFRTYLKIDEVRVLLVRQFREGRRASQSDQERAKESLKASQSDPKRGQAERAREGEALVKRKSLKQISLAYSPAHSGLLSGSKWLSVVPCWSRSGFHCSLPLSGSLLVSNFAYTVLAWLARSLLGSQRCCHESSLYQGPLQKNLFFKFFIYQPVQSKSLFVISVSKISCDTETLPTSSTPAVIVLLTITQVPEILPPRGTLSWTISGGAHEWAVVPNLPALSMISKPEHRLIDHCTLYQRLTSEHWTWVNFLQTVLKNCHHRVFADSLELHK